MKIAIVHDALCVAGGAERFVLWMLKAFPEADLFTSVYLPDGTFPEFKKYSIKTFKIGRWIKTEKQFKILLPLWLFLIRRLNLASYDIVISSSTYLAKYLKVSPGVKHFCYLYAPFRFLWKPSSYSPESLPVSPFLASILKLVLPLLRKWDKRITQRIPQLLTSCNNMAEEIKKVYQKPTKVIYPPVDLSEYPLTPGGGDYFLSVSRLISHKKVDLAIQACNQLARRLLIVGDGPEKENLKFTAGETIQFLGKVSDEDLKQLYTGAKALLFPSHEDYGIVPLEAQACGVPVLAYGQGGALETIRAGKSGLFFESQTVEALIACIEKFENMTFDPQEIRAWVTKFGSEVFVSEFRKAILDGSTTE